MYIERCLLNRRCYQRMTTVLLMYDITNVLRLRWLMNPRSILVDSSVIYQADVSEQYASVAMTTH